MYLPLVIIPLIFPGKAPSSSRTTSTPAYVLISLQMDAPMVSMEVVDAGELFVAIAIGANEHLFGLCPVG